MNGTTIRWIVGIVCVLTFAWAGWVSTTITAVQIKQAILETQLAALSTQLATVSLQINTATTHILNVESKLSTLDAKFTTQLKER